MARHIALLSAGSSDRLRIPVLVRGCSLIISCFVQSVKPKSSQCPFELNLCLTSYRIIVQTFLSILLGLIESIAPYEKGGVYYNDKISRLNIRPPPHPPSTVCCRILHIYRCFVPILI